MPSPSDPVELALRSDRGSFILACPHHFLYCGSGIRHDSSARRRTQEIAPIRAFDDITDVTGRIIEEDGSGGALVVAVRKVIAEFPGMITVGRTTSNDVVIDDVQISKFHAFIRAQPGGYELSDAGSRNGTWIDGERLVPKASWTSATVTPGRPIARGSRIRFARLEFEFIDAPTLWDRLHGKD